MSTGIDPLAWERLLETDPRLFGTVLDVMRAKAGKEKPRKRRGRR